MAGGGLRRNHGANGATKRLRGAIEPGGRLGIVNGRHARRSVLFLLGTRRIERFEVDRLQENRCEPGSGYRLGNDFAGVREKNVRASDREQRFQVLFGNVLNTENSGLADLDEEQRFFRRPWPSR